MSSDNVKTVLENDVEKLVKMETTRFKQCEQFHDMIYACIALGDTTGAIRNLELYKKSCQAFNRIEGHIISLTIEASSAVRVLARRNKDGL